MQYRDLNTYLRERFGKKVYKISLSTPFTCPNRDGTKGVGGCIFCSGQGSGSFAAEACLPVSEQLRQGKSRVRKKAGEGAGYIAYFQAFTSTYGPVSVQKKLFEEALADPEVVALSVATRPDCLPEEVLELLGSLNEKKPVFFQFCKINPLLFHIWTKAAKPQRYRLHSTSSSRLQASTCRNSSFCSGVGS